MSPFEKSLLCWIGGGVLGAALVKDHRVLGFLGGAIVVGAVSDVVIERQQMRRPLRDLDNLISRYPLEEHIR